MRISNIYVSFLLCIVNRFILYITAMMIIDNNVQNKIPIDVVKFNDGCLGLRYTTNNTNMDIKIVITCFFTTFLL